jgi:putative transposase
MIKSREELDGSPEAAVAEAWQQVGASFERFCLTAGVSALSRMMEQDAIELCGPRYGHKDGKVGQRWGKTQGKIGFHGGKVSVDRPRVRCRDGEEMALPSWEASQSEDLLGRWAMNLMLINVSTRRFGRAVRLPEGHIPALGGAGVSKSAVSRRFVALSAAQMIEWMAADLSKLNLLVIQIALACAPDPATCRASTSLCNGPIAGRSALTSPMAASAVHAITRPRRAGSAGRPGSIRRACS